MTTKLVRNPYSLLVVLLLLVNLESFGQSLQGSWTLDIDKSIESMRTEDKLRFDTLAADTKVRARNSMRDREFIFEQNGNATIKWKARGEDKTTTGTWSEDAATKTLRIMVDEIYYDYTYERPDKTTLILFPVDTGGYFRVLYFKETPKN